MAGHSELQIKKQGLVIMEAANEKEMNASVNLEAFGKYRAIVFHQ